MLPFRFTPFVKMAKSDFKLHFFSLQIFGKPFGETKNPDTINFSQMFPAFHMFGEGQQQGCVRQHLAVGVVTNQSEVLVPLVTSQRADFQCCMF